MGYLSDVAIALSSVDNERFTSQISGHTLNLWLAATKQAFIRDDGSPWVVLQWHDLKWFKGFIEEVDTIEAFLETVPHEFLRSGELLEDTEHENTSEYYDILFVEKKVVIYL